MNPTVYEYLLKKKQEESQFGAPEAVAVGLSGLGDAFKGAAGMNTNHAKETLGVIQGGDKSRMDQIKSYLEGKTAESTIAKNAAEAAKLNKEANAPAKPESLDDNLARQVKEGKLTIEQAYAMKSPGRNDMLDFRKEEAAKKDAEAQEKKDLAAKGRVIPGFESDGSVVIDDVEAKKLRDGSAEFETFVQTAKEYRDMIDKYGTQEMTNPEVQARMESLAKNLQLKVKSLAQLGVLSATDIPFIERQISDPGFWKFESGMKGRLDTTSGMMQRSFENQMKSRGYKRSGGGTPPPSENPRSVSNVGQTKIKNGITYIKKEDGLWHPQGR